MITVEPAAFGRKTDDALLLLCCEEERELYRDPRLLRLLGRARTLGEFRGRRDEELVLYDPPEVGPRRVILRGLGRAEAADPESLRQAAGRAVRRAQQMKRRAAAIAAPEEALAGASGEAALQALLEGAVLGNHRVDRERAEREAEPLARIRLLVPEALAGPGRRIAREVEAVCGAQLLARDWVNLPANEKPPARLAARIAREARRAGLAVERYGEAELRRLKMGALLAVARGSAARPVLLVLRHGRPRRPPAVLVGKGVVFDAGGINLKTGESLADMKADMAGAAAVAATLIGAARLGLERPLVGVIPLVENMLSGSAMRPGDIVTGRGGKRIEIGNTDAEGRLILADALAWAEERFSPAVLVDVATLTGACVVALGERIAGVFSPQEDLGRALLEAGRRTGERCWPMPLPEDYREFLKSHLANIRNLPSTRAGGAITAALFLQAFVGRTPWAHLDIAGPAFQKQESAFCGPGATGFGVRLLLDWLRGEPFGPKGDGRDG